MVLQAVLRELYALKEPSSGRKGASRFTEDTRSSRRRKDAQEQRNLQLPKVSDIGHGGSPSGGGKTSSPRGAEEPARAAKAAPPG